MPLHLTIDAQRRLVVSSGWGVVSDSDLLVGRRLLESNPEFDPSFDRIWDLTGATALSLSDETLRQFARKSLSEPLVRRAIVCVAPAVVPKVLEFVSESRACHRDVAVFPTRREAAEWMEIEGL
jgi:hypothetical protein